jgi:hypothetical protein
MDEPIAERGPDICHRCLQPVPEKARRCPHCGDPLQKSPNMRLLLGLFGLMVFVVVAFFAVVRLTHSGDAGAPPDDAQQQQDGSAPRSPPPPEVKPALGQ